MNSVYMQRVCLGLTQAELAEKAGISRRTVIAIENWQSRPSVDIALAIGEVLDVPVDRLFRLRG